MHHAAFIGGPLDGTTKQRSRFPACLSEDGVTPLRASTYQRRSDLYVHQIRVPGDGTKKHVYVHATLPLTTGVNR